MKTAEFVRATRLTTNPEPRQIELSFPAIPRRFASGAVGYHLRGDIILQVGGKPALFRVSGNIMLVAGVIDHHQPHPSNRMASVN